MVSIKDLRVCKSCGNIFSSKVGSANIIECPQCKGTSFQSIKMETGEEPEEVYLDEID